MKTDWLAPTPKIFTGRFVTLTPTNANADTGELFASSHDSAEARALWRFMPCGPFADAEEMREWIQKWQGNPDVIPFTVTNGESGRRVGMISLMRITPAHGVAELGFIWYAPPAQQTKANTEANYLLLRHCFADLSYRRMEWKCDAENARSRAAALRLGYSFEGIFRQHMVIKGRNRDTAWFAMLDHEWARIAAAMEHWLYVDDSQPLAARRTDTRSEQ
jgi:RimJ/RimL family protein N-acetyltransferase